MTSKLKSLAVSTQIPLIDHFREMRLVGPPISYIDPVSKKTLITLLVIHYSLKMSPNLKNISFNEILKIPEQFWVIRRREIFQSFWLNFSSRIFPDRFFDLEEKLAISEAAVYAYSVFRFTIRKTLREVFGFLWFSVKKMFSTTTNAPKFYYNENIVA